MAETARAGGLHIIAVADHDTVAGVKPAVEAVQGSVHVIPAIELSTTHNGAELHMLGYYIDPAHPDLVDHGALAGGARDGRMREMIDRLNSAGVGVTWEDVQAAAAVKPHSIGRPHLARALVQRGHAHSVSDAFDRLIGDHAPAFVPTRLVTPFEAIDLIHAAGGVAVWAHPRFDIVEAALPEFRARGLDGVECHRPRVATPDAEWLADVAARHDLVVTGGSDWHGDWHGRLGDWYVERDDVAAFLEIGGI